MKTIILSIWSVISLLLALVLAGLVNHTYGWRGLVALVAFLVFVHIVFRKKTGRWIDTNGN